MYGVFCAQERLTERECEERYIELLNDCYPPVKLTGDMEYGVGDVLKEMDPIVFAVGLDEEIVHRVEDGEWCVAGYEEYEPECECASDEVHESDCCKGWH